MARGKKAEPEPEEVEIPDLDDFDDDGIAVALLSLGSRARDILQRAAELAKDGFDPKVDRLVYQAEEEGDDEAEDEENHGKFDTLGFFADVAQSFARAAKRR